MSDQDHRLLVVEEKLDDSLAEKMAADVDIQGRQRVILKPGKRTEFERPLLPSLHSKQYTGPSLLE